MSSKLTGNWKGVIALTSNLDKDLISSSKSYLLRESEELKNKVKDVIQNQTESWTPLAKDTIERKGSDKMLIETGQLLDSIEVVKQSDLEYVITPQGNHSSGISNSQLAMYQEYGTSKIPPRPFFRPVGEENTTQVVEEVKEIVQETINKYK